MKRADDRSVSPNRGFSLVEVLLALAMAAVGFGVVLHSVGRQMAVVSGSLDRHQMLMYASEALESNLARGVINNEVEEQEVPIGAFGDTDRQAATSVVWQTTGLGAWQPSALGPAAAARRAAR